MGKAIRWLKGLFGIKLKDMEIEGKAEKKGGQTIGSSGRGVTAAAAAAALCNNPTTIPPNITPAEAAWLSSFFSDKEQSQHAIAVAAATAAAADAAAAAAHAAVEVVRLTSQGGGAYFSREKWAAVKIQAAFRGYLARKALRCLKGLVKIQALVRGYLVRKQATATFHSMQALMRAQASVRAQKFRASFLNHQISFPRSFPSRKSIERSDETTRSGRHPSPFEVSTNGNDDNPKIVEIDSAFRPTGGRRSRRAHTWVPEPGDEAYGSGGCSGPSLFSPLSCRIPARSSITDYRNFQDSEWGTTAGDECRFSTAQSTPRFPNSCGSNTPVTPANSVCVESAYFRSYDNFPNYMADTEAFRAKLRSQSAPKQRPEPGPGPRKRLSSPHTQMIMESRASVSGGRMRISCSQAQEVINFKNAVMGKLDRSIEFS